ncbi:hypothetical protein GCM10010505_69030 [Kitasatospora aburaviensis]
MDMQRASVAPQSIKERGWKFMATRPAPTDEEIAAFEAWVTEYDINSMKMR